MAARRLSIPVVYTNHYLPANARPSTEARSAMFDRAFYAYLVAFANRCTLTTAPTSTALDLLRQRGLRVPSTVISNGVDLRRFSPGPAADRTRRRYRPDRGAPLILAVGRLSPEKRLDVLLEAVSRLGEGVDVAIAGVGPEGPSLHALAGRLDLGRRVRFLGFVPDGDLPDLYRLADIFAIPSAAELQSLTTLEAMASGLPVVAADAYALPELVAHGRSGFLSRLGSAGDLAAHLDKLITDRSLRSSMGAQSVVGVRPHDLQVVVDRWESCYRALAVVGR
jgi:glycosyltransferase involved in cell wall biosynthesis